MSHRNDKHASYTIFNLWWQQIKLHLSLTIQINDPIWACQNENAYYDKMETGEVDFLLRALKLCHNNDRVSLRQVCLLEKIRYHIIINLIAE